MATTRYIALLRGINVGGKNIITMDRLRACLEDAGFGNVRTYIASGNVLFTSDVGFKKVESIINKTLENAFDYRGPTVVLTATDFTTVVKEAPNGFGAEPDNYHSDVIFLKLPVKAEAVLQDVLGLKLREGVDTAQAGSKALYFTRLSAQRTKSRMGQIVGLASYKSMTIRSWNTVSKLSALLAE
jgi:uncharacterized protein (DUF1697 family)